jgi:endonuclease/exonuclease/phosphatase family metal-dependent hydrolase
MGDFNCGSDDGVLAPIRQKLVDTCRSADTAGAREAQRVGTLLGGTARIDHIFVSRQDFSVADAGLVPEAHRRVSDHIGYFAALRFNTALDGC